MPDKPKISDADRQLFRNNLKDVRQLKQKHHYQAPRPKIKPVARQRIADDRQVLDDMFSDDFHPDDVETGEELLFSRPGLQTRLMRQLRRGQLSVSAELDLHGYTVVEARQALTEFLRDSLRHGDRCVRIVHGKGFGSKQKLPVLKNKVNTWLQQRDEVLAFCSARPVDGGTGAVYVLLKRL
jgi:DNA-nicking Smr family endonuclease